MILLDVNLWVYAFRGDSPLHEKARVEIRKILDEGISFIFSPHIAGSFLRLVTNPRVFATPSDAGEAWGFIEALQGHPRAVYAEVDPMTFGIFKHITLVHKDGGNRIPDALLAAIAIRHECELVTADAGFRRYQGLKVRIIG